MRHRNAVPLWLGFALVLLLLPTEAVAQHRTALVIGNATYEREPLRTPMHDATDMAATLEQLGFMVTLLHDVPQQAMEEALVVFGQQLRGSELGLFYFAGHGIQDNGEQYLIPIGAHINGAQDVQPQAFPLQRILKVVDTVSTTPVILVLATSRNNPFARSQGGLAVAQCPQNGLIAYATAPGRRALEGTGRNSIYTKYLLQHITTHGLSLAQFFKSVRPAVEQETEGKQTPWEISSLRLRENIYLVRKPE